MNAPVDRWRETVCNDFEPVVFRAHPRLERLRNEMYRRGAVYASMTGSGAAVYGIFDGGVPIDSDFGKMFVYQEDMA